MIRSEDAQRTAWIFVDISGRDLGGYVAEAKRVAEEKVPMPVGYTRVWSGRFEYLESANQRLKVVIPITFALIVLLLYVSNKSWFRVGVVLLAVPFSLIGAFWTLWALDYNMSLAVWVGIIALLGIDAETGQVMLLYLDTTYDRFVKDGRMRSKSDLFEAIYEGAVKRIRPKTMTVATDMIDHDDPIHRYLDVSSISPEDVAESVVRGIAAEQFLILPHPQVSEYVRLKSEDFDRWIRGMQRMRQKMTRQRKAA